MALNNLKRVDMPLNKETKPNQNQTKPKPNQTKKAGGVENWMTSGDRPNYSIVKIGQNTEKSPGDLGRLAVTQTPVKDYKLTLI